MPRKPEVVSHWHQLYENFGTSSRDFYSAVEEGIRKREVPDLTFSRVVWKESGILSAKREYLRVARGRLHWDICAAPFGTGFFFSSRLAVYPNRLAGLIYLLLFSASAYGAHKLFLEPHDFDRWIVPLRIWLTLVHDVPLVVALFLLLGTLARMKVVVDDDAVLAMPFFGFLYEKVFNPETYFKEDTDVMFKEAVQAAMLEAVDAVTTGKRIHAVTAAAEDAPQGDESEWGAEASA